MEDDVRVCIRKPFPKVFSFKKLAISMPGGKRNTKLMAITLLAIGRHILSISP
jgi:hypothetical protein